MQSPLNIADAVPAYGDPIVFEYGPVPLNIINNGHTVQVNYTPGSGITVSGRRYELLQFHFHAPSEHSIAGRLAAMEMHLVHRNEAGPARGRRGPAGRSARRTRRCVRYGHKCRRRGRRSGLSTAS